MSSSFYLSGTLPTKAKKEAISAFYAATEHLQAEHLLVHETEDGISISIFGEMSMSEVSDLEDSVKEVSRGYACGGAKFMAQLDGQEYPLFVGSSIDVTLMVEREDILAEIAQLQTRLEQIDERLAA